MTDESRVTLLTQLYGRLKPASRWALDTALSALVTEDVGGTLILEVPRNPHHQPDARFVSGKPVVQLAQSY